MKMRNTKVLLLVLFVAMFVELGHPWTDEFVEDAKDVANDAKEKTQSFTDWAYGKISHGLGVKDDEKPLNENAKFQIEETASKFTDSVKSTASEASNYATKAGEDAKEKAKEAYDEAAKASNTFGNKATETYDQAKDKVGNAYDSTKESVKGSI